MLSLSAETEVRAPTSGGQYHWTYMLAPKSCQKFFSYIMGMPFRKEALRARRDYAKCVLGWLVICGWQALVSCTSSAGPY